ncbi:MAG: phage holin family protein [Croceibacterium sp.]
MIDDGKTYLEAELAFQKSRAALVADGAKSAAVLGALAAVCAVLALVALAIGLLLALTPLITAWGATAVVVGGLLLAAFFAVRVAGKRWRNMMSAVSGDSTP